MRAKRKSRWFILLFSLAAILFVAGGRLSWLRAQSVSEIDLLSQANILYEDGRYDEAIRIYERLVDLGIESSVVYYNLGNAHFKEGDLGRAILNYRRANRLSPRDPDIRSNLALARSLTIDKYSSEEDSALFRLVTVARSWMTLNETAALTLGLWVAFSGLVLAYNHSRAGYLREGILYTTILVLLLLAGGIFSLGSLLYVEKTGPEAVIVAQEVDVMSGPGDQYVTEFTLHSGAEVSLLERRNDWGRLALPGGQLEGWVPEDAAIAVARPDR